MEMENFEIALGIRRKIAEAIARVPKIEAELLERQKAQPALDEEELKSLILEKPDAQRRKKEAKENREAIRALKEERATVNQRIEILEEEEKKVEDAALGDVRRRFRKPYEEAVKRLAEAYDEVEKLEMKVLEIKEEAARMGHQITPISYMMTPYVKLLLIDPSDPIPRQWPIAEFRRDCEKAGIALNGAKK